MTRDEIIEETKKDNISNLLIKVMSSNSWGDIRLQKFKKINNELSVTEDGIILRGTRIFLPNKLGKRAILIAHESHQGVEKPKALFREKVWFPKMAEFVEEVIRTCIPCLAM